MNSTARRQPVSFLIVAFILFSTQFFNYMNWNPTYAGWCSYFIYAFILLYVYVNRSHYQYTYDPFRKELWILLLYPLFSIIIGFIINIDFSLLYEERRYIFAFSAFLFYYIYKIYNFGEDDIVKIFTVIAIAIFCIQIFQIIFPKMGMFGIYDEEMQNSRHAIAEIRNGIYRFRLPGLFFTLYCLYYYWNRLLLKITVRDCIHFAVLSVSTYLYLTRQIMFATAFTLTCSVLFIQSNRIKMKYIFIMVMCGMMLLYFIDVLFKEFYDKTLKEVNPHNIRWIATKFYWQKICEDPMTFLFGNGHPKLMHKWQEKGLHPSDIGFIGEMFHYGVLWIAIYFYSVYMILIKYARKLPLYIKLFVLGTFTNSIMIFPYRNSSEYLVWATILYVASLYITRIRLPHEGTCYNQ